MQTSANSHADGVRLIDNRNSIQSLLTFKYLYYYFLRTFTRRFNNFYVLCSSSKEQ